MKTQSSSFILVKFAQESRTQEVVIDAASFVIGRSSGCDVLIDELSISRQHIRVHFDGTKIEIEDLGSSNGTFYQGQRLSRGQRVSFVQGTRVTLGLARTYVWFEKITKDLPVLSEDTNYVGPTENFDVSDSREVLRDDFSLSSKKKKTRSENVEQKVLISNQELLEEKKILEKEAAEFEKRVHQSRVEAERIIQDALRMKNEISLDREKSEIEFQRSKKSEMDHLHQELKQKRESEFQDLRKKREEFEAELLAYEKQRLGEMRELEKEINLKQEMFQKDKDAFETVCKQRLASIENLKLEAQRQKELMLIEAQQNALVENKKILNEMHDQAVKAESKAADLLSQARADVESIKQAAETESKQLLEKAKETANIIRRSAEEEGQILRERKEKDLLAAQQKSEETVKQILAQAESRKQEILQKADAILVEASREAEERTANAKKLFAKIEGEAEAEKQLILKKFEDQLAEARLKMDADLQEKRQEIGRLTELKQQIFNEQSQWLEKNDSLKSLHAQWQLDVEKTQVQYAELQKNSSESATHLQKMKIEMQDLETKRSELLQTVSELQRKNEQVLARAKEDGEQVLNDYEKSLNEKKSKEEQILEKKRVELALEFKSEEERLRKVFAEKSKAIAKNLVQFLQIYHLENKGFDLKVVSDQALKSFEQSFHENLLSETKTNPPSAQIDSQGKIQVPSQKKNFGYLIMGSLMLFLAIPQFLPAPLRQKLSLIDRFNPSAGADRYIASLKTDRNRRYTPEKVKFVFDSFRLNVLYSADFASKWKSDGFQKKWIKHLQNHFFSKYRISEEVMIQIVSKEGALVDSMSKIALDTHPDFFKISFEKMQKEETETLNEIQRLLANDVAFQDYKQQQFEIYKGL